jgi:hypothetical protein
LKPAIGEMLAGEQERELVAAVDRPPVGAEPLNR